MRNEEILQEVDRRFLDQKELIESKFTHLSAVIQTGFDFASHERGEIIKRQDITNGRVTKLEEDGYDYKDHIKNAARIWKHKGLLLAGILLMLFLSSVLAAWLVENVDVLKTFEHKTGIELIDK